MIPSALLMLITLVIYCGYPKLTKQFYSKLMMNFTFSLMLTFVLFIIQSLTNVNETKWANDNYGACLLIGKYQF